MNNQVTIIGHVGQKPTTVQFPRGKSVVKFSVAVKEFSAAEEEPKTLWLDVEAWNGNGERVLSAITKGREVLVTGRLMLNTYDVMKDGMKHLVTKPVIRMATFYLCGRKPLETELEANAEKPAAKSKKTKAA